MTNTPYSFRQAASFLGSESGSSLARSDPEDARGLLGRIAELVNKQKGGPLSRCDLEEQSSHVLAHLGLDVAVALLGWRGLTANRHRGATASHPEPVERDPEQVAGGIADRVDPVPAFPELQERLLGQVLGFLTAARDEVEGLEQSDVLLRDERVEPGPVFGLSGREAYDLAFCLHGPWMHGCPGVSRRASR